ncbi:MAG TPA: tetratricopeptide repeat protein [Longimicrobiales bacterium]|nr:tetratricopeptide repeat protein [Longimicrobiales bacterium]
MPDADQLLDRARESFERRDYLAALADLREIVDAHPHFADVRHLMGLCLSLLGQPENALDQFDRALVENDAYIEAHLNRAITLNELGRYDEAREAFARAAECEGKVGGRFPASVSARLANAHAGMGELYMAASAPAEAAAQFRRALELRGTFHDIRNRLGEALMQLGKLEEARGEFERALEGNGRFLQARLNLGLVHYRSGALDAAREHWEEARSQDPSSPQVRAYLRLLEEQKAER